MLCRHWNTQCGHVELQIVSVRRAMVKEIWWKMGYEGQVLLEYHQKRHVCKAHGRFGGVAVESKEKSVTEIGGQLLKATHRAVSVD